MTVNTFAEYFRTDCNILGDKIKKKKQYIYIYIYQTLKCGRMSPAGHVLEIRLKLVELLIFFNAIRSSLCMVTYIYRLKLLREIVKANHSRPHETRNSARIS